MKTLEELMHIALKIEKPIEICWPNRGNVRETVEPADYRFCNHCYSTNNDAIAFVYDNILYILLYSTKAERILVESGFKKKHFYVPLLKEAYPIGSEEKWQKMQEKVSNKQDWFDRCIIYSNQKGYGILEEKLLEEYCLEIPKEGIKVRRIDSSNFTHYPAIKSMHNNIAMNRIGRYSIRNGVCAFVYRNGKTYITCSSVVIETLQKAGYKKDFLWVPLSNRDEMILDPDYAKKWKKVSTFL